MSSQGRSLSDPSPPPSPGVPGEGVVDRTGTRPARERRPTWLKVLLGLLLVIVLLLGCAFLAHGIWRGKERSRADAIVAGIRARGEPTTVGELIDATVPDEQNIVVLFRKAQSEMVTNKDREERESLLSVNDKNAFEPPLTEAEAALLREASAENAAALALLRRLDERKLVAWDNPPATPMASWLLPELNGLRSVAMSLADDARLAMHEGRQLDAIEALRDIKPLALAAGRRPLLIGYLVSIGIHAVAAERALEFAPALSFHDPAVRAATERLIVELLDDRPAQQAIRAGMLGERVSVHDTLRSAVAGTGGGAVLRAGLPMGTNPVQRYLMSPLLYRGDATMLEYLSVVLAHVDAPDFASFKTRAVEMKVIEAAVSASNVDLMSKIMMPSMNRAVMTRYRGMADRQLAATALAIRLYQHDHASERPQTLNDLVPRYLPALPLDPIDGQPLRYDRARAILWSVGDNEKDDGGDATPRRPAYTHRWSLPDAVVPLERKPRPATAPAADEIMEGVSS